MQTIHLDMPPSANVYYRHVGKMVLKSKEARLYGEHVKEEVAKQCIEPIGTARLAVHVSMIRADRRRADLSNFAAGKGLYDAMQEAGVYDDDGQIDVLAVERGPIGKKACVVVSLAPILNPADGWKMVERARGVLQ